MSINTKRGAEQPLVSLCCSTHSRPDLFPEALAGMLQQSYAPLEIVVLVDGANPASTALLAGCKDPRLRWFVTPQPSGMIAAWNRVAAAARGKYFLYCADDDVLCVSAIERQVDLLEANPQVAFCHADFHLIDDDGACIGQWRSHEGTWIEPGLAEWQRYLMQPKCCMQSCVIRRDLWQQVQGWDEDAGYPGDNSLYLKLLRIGDVGHVDHFACRYRIRTHAPDSWLKNAAKVRDDWSLACRHLADAPSAIAGRVGRLQRKLRHHCARNALAVLAERRGGEIERAVFRNWLCTEVLRGTGERFFYRAVLAMRLEGIIAALKSINQRARNVVRHLAVKVRQLAPAR
jgi:GT2 family glycosyltransferase